MILLWALLTVISVIIWAVGNIIDKFLLSKYFKNPYIPTIFVSIFGFLASIVIFLAVEITFPTIELLIISLLVGFLYAFVNLFYFKSLFIEEVSRVVPLFTLVPLFVLILAALFLNEVFTNAVYLGIMLLVAGAFIISWEHGESRFKLNKAFWLMLIADIIFTLPILGLKYELSYMTPEAALFWAGIGMMLAVPFFLPFCYKKLTSVASKSKKPIIYVSISSLILISGLYVMFAAADMAEITLISALGQTQMFFVLIFATIITFFRPKLLEEKITKRDIIEKVIATVLMFIGVVLIL